MPRENYNVNWQISWVIGVHEVLMPFLIQSWQQDINLGCCLAHCHPVSARNLKSSLLPSISLLSSAPKRTLPQLPSAPSLYTHNYHLSPICFHSHETFASVALSLLYAYTRRHFPKAFWDLVAAETLNMWKQNILYEPGQTDTTMRWHSLINTQPKFRKYISAENAAHSEAARCRGRWLHCVCEMQIHNSHKYCSSHGVFV